jgi:4-hydroxy-tetrahydrodipicolinate reductase
MDVLIDFTLPEGCVSNARAAAQQGIALVIGTTGLNPEQLAAIDDCARQVPVIHAPNFSVGVNVLFKAAEMVARTLGDEYQVEIVEAHHDQKVDAPSGTALGLARSIAKGLERDLEACAIYGRKGHTGVRPQKEIGIHTLRMGDVVGEHTAYFAIGGERLELTHKASSRDTFARGAIRAAKWLIQQRKGPGKYSIAEVLGLA